MFFHFLLFISLSPLPNNSTSIIYYTIKFIRNIFDRNVNKLIFTKSHGVSSHDYHDWNFAWSSISKKREKKGKKKREKRTAPLVIIWFAVKFCGEPR